MRLYTLLALFILSTISLQGQANIKVMLTDGNSGKPILFGTVALYQDGLLVAGTESDLEGVAYFDNIPYGKYKLEGSYVGYENASLDIELKEAKTYEYKIKLKEGSVLEEVQIVAYKTPLINTSIGFSSDVIASSKAPSGVKVRSKYRSKKESLLPASGQVTAGEWNDLHNWKDWLDLLEDEDYQIMTSRWGISPKSRYSVLVLNDNNVPVINAKTVLYDSKDAIIWEGYTDNTGKAELWSDVYISDQEANYIIVTYGAKSKTLNTIKPIEEGSNTVVLQGVCNVTKSVDIVFTVDATSSMSDEIQYLKSELLDVIDRVVSEGTEIDLRMGAVFYRDVTDEYLTKKSPLSGDIEKTLSFINEQRAAGGGDSPEAVEIALEESLLLDWRADALKLNFLILDAPPHEDDTTLANLRVQIQEAARKGVRLIPITASGINRQTEFLMKFMAILTNGTYVFITDDSGIGNPHLAPVVDDYEVEKLNDLMVRVISQFISVSSCDESIDMAMSQDFDVSVYPNPCANYFMVRTDDKADKILLSANGGMIVNTIIPTSKEVRVDVENLVSGVYTVTVVIGDHRESKRLLVVR